jgi:hypothetical protein
MHVRGIRRIGNECVEGRERIKALETVRVDDFDHDARRRAFQERMQKNGARLNG